MEVVHYGETGKATYTFTFQKHLIDAIKLEYRYDFPIYVNANVKPKLEKSTILKSEEGRRTLPADFEEYKTHFRKSALAKCGRKVRP